jgi:iron complex transport system ATP-binding protein
MSSHEVNLSIKYADKIILFTETEIFAGSPNLLIKNNSFDNLFPKEIVTFNRNLEQFIINKN